MQNKFDVNPELIEAAKLNEDELNSIYEKVLFMPIISTFAETWQLQLATGKLDYFEEHIEKPVGDYNIWHYALMFSGPEVLNFLKKWNEPLLAATLNRDEIIFLLTFVSPANLDWIKAYNPEILLNEYPIKWNFAHQAALKGVASTLEWIKINEDTMLQSLCVDNTSIMHIAALSGNKETLTFCNNYDKNLQAELDENECDFVYYASRSYNPEQVNFSLSLSSRPWELENIFMGYNELSDSKMLATIYMSLDENITLQSISYSYKNSKPYDEQSLCTTFNNGIQNRLNRNIQIQQDFNTIRRLYSFLYLGVLLDKKSHFCEFSYDLVFYIGKILFNTVIPIHKSHLVNHTFFAQVYKNLDVKPIEVVDKDSSLENICSGYVQDLFGLRSGPGTLSIL